MKNGSRLILWYQVDFDLNHSIPNSICHSNTLSKFGEIFEEWKKYPSLLGIRLENSYSYRSLKIEHLKANDFEMMCALKVISKYFPIQVYLTTIKKYQESDPDSIKEEKGTLCIDHWVDLNDKVVNFGKTQIVEESLFPKNSFEPIRCFNNESFERYNEGNGKKKLKLNSCLVTFFVFSFKIVSEIRLWTRFGFILIFPTSFACKVFEKSENLIPLFQGTNFTPFFQNSEKQTNKQTNQ